MTGVSGALPAARSYRQAADHARSGTARTRAERGAFRPRSRRAHHGFQLYYRTRRHRYGNGTAILRRRRAIPEGTDKLFITDKDNVLLGELPLTDILLNQPETPVFSVMNDRPTTFRLDDKAEDAAGAFERYNLISAAVIDDKGKLIGRVTIEDVIDPVNEENESNIRKMGGLSREEEVFAPVKGGAHPLDRLAINLCTAFVASRVIGLFEETISQLVALATLMPIVAGIGGNTGNQTITMIVRALALHQVEPGNFSFLFLRELGVALINGLFWGGIMGGITADV